MSFLPGLRETPVFKFLLWLTEPVLSPLRSLLSKHLPENFSKVDFSPIAAYLILIILRALITGFL